MSDFLTTAERKQIKQEIAIQENHDRLRADRERRNLKHRCAYCGSDKIATHHREGQPEPVGRSPAKLWLGKGKALGHVEIGRCTPCMRLYPPYWTEADASTLWHRLQETKQLAYVAGDPASVLPPLSWAGWEYRNRLAGGDVEVGDPARPFSHLTDNVPDPSTIDWNPEIP